MNWTKRFLLTCLLAVISTLGFAQTLVNCATATPCTMSGPSNTNTGDRAWLAFGKINTDLLILAPLFNSTGLPFTLPVTSGGTGATTLTGLVKGNGTSAFTGGNLSGDCTTSGFVVTCTKTNGVTFAPSATTDTTSAANITSGQLPSLARLPSIANNTILGNSSGSTAAPAALTALPAGISVQTFSAGNTSTAPVPNFANGATQTWTQNGNVTWGVPTNPPTAGQHLTLVVTQDGTGGYTTAWNAIYKNVPLPPAASVANSKAIYTFIWNGSTWNSPDNYASTPFPLGAVGDGSVDDTAAVQACFDTLYCILPKGYRFRIDHTLTVKTGATILGQGATANGLPASILYANPVVAQRINGPIVQIGNSPNPTYLINITFKDIFLYGFARQYMLIQGVTNLMMDNVVGGALNNGVDNLCTDGFIFNAVFDSHINSLDASGVNFKTTMTFTASVGGASSGTLTGALAYDGSYPAIFSDGQQRYITATGTAVTWTPALSAGTITTAQIGSTFWIKWGFGPNTLNNWHAANGGPYGLYMQDETAGGGQTTNTFNTLISETSTIPLYIGGYSRAQTFNSPYLQGGRPIVLGNNATSNPCQAITLNSPNLEGPFDTDSSYALRVAFIEVDNCNGVTITSPTFLSQYPTTQLTTIAPLTITGGPGTGATAIARVSATGTISSVLLLTGGTGYTGTPTVAVGGVGTGATVTATQSGGVVNSITLTGGGSGFVNSPLLPIRYGNAWHVRLIGVFFNSQAGVSSVPMWPWVVRTAAAPATAGISILDDYPWVTSAAPSASAMLTKADGGSSLHYVTWLNSSGVQQAQAYTPPVFP